MFGQVLGLEHEVYVERPGHFHVNLQREETGHHAIGPKGPENI